MPRTPALHPAAREHLLRAAQHLMLKQGFTATSVDEICQQAALSKGTFFHYFKSKEDLGARVLDYYIDGWMQAILAAPFQKEKNPLRRIYLFIDFFLDKSRDPSFAQSCLLGNLAQELSRTHSVVRVRCSEHFQKWARALEKELKSARALYRPKSAINTRSLADHFLIVFEGSLLLAKTGGAEHRKALQESLNHYKAYIKMLFEQ